MEALLWIGLTALLIAAPFIYPRWRLRRVLARPLPPAAEAVLQRNIPVYKRMSPDLQQQLRRMVVQFLHQKNSSAARGWT
jgi:Mlc titration factor MtfA (ptsG expression regulator)